MLLHQVDEEKGELPTRTIVQVESATLEQSIIGWDADRWMAEMMIERGWVPPDSERPARSGNGDRSAVTEPAPAAAPTASAAPATESRTPTSVPAAEPPARQLRGGPVSVPVKDPQYVLAAYEHAHHAG